MKKLRILLTGGGTGGHIFPLIAVAQELIKQAESFGLELNLRYFGSERRYAQEIVDSNMDFVPVISAKWRQYFSLLNFIDLIKFPFSLLQLLWKIYWFMPDVVFSKGGPGALAVVLVSRFYFIPVIVHDSDSIPGLTNKISGRFAKKIFLAFASAGDYFQNKNIEVVGNPVRDSLFQEANSLGLGNQNPKAEAIKGFGLDPNQPVILVLGGSQGAERINNFIMENAEILIRDFQILHQTGERNYDNYKKEFEFMTKDWSNTEKNLYHFQAVFVKDMADALIAADAVIARAGSGTIFELAAFGKPAILIPLPESARDHQKTNAYLYAETGAAIVIEEENLLGNLMINKLKEIISSPERLQKMSEAAKSFYRPDAAAVIAKYLLTYV